MVVFFVVIPLLAAFLVPLVSKMREGSARVLAVLTGSLLLLLSIAGIFMVKNGSIVYSLGGWRPPFGICMVLDGLSVFFLLIINLIGFIALIYSWDYIKRYSSQGLYYTLFCLMLSGLNGVAVSGDLFNLYVFLEITSIASYALVAFGTQAEELEAAFKYMVLGSVASAFILLAIGILFGSVSTLNMADIARSLADSGSRKLILFCLGLFTMGFSLKAGLVPFHTWLPDAHPAAPAPVSAMLSGVVIKVIGIYALIRLVFNVFIFTPAISQIFIWMGIISMSVGVLLAIGQWDFKRLLAYHSISQIGYVIFGIGLGTPLGIIGGLFHLFNHSLFKSLLFLNAGSLEYATGTRKLQEINGSGRAMPFTSVSSLVASLSIAGVPPLCGFWSKLIIIIAAFQAGNIIGGITCILVGMVTLASFLKVQKYAFSKQAGDIVSKIKEVPLTMVAAMSVLALFCVLIGLFFVPFLDQLIRPATNVLLEGANYVNLILGG